MKKKVENLKLNINVVLSTLVMLFLLLSFFKTNFGILFVLLILLAYIVTNYSITKNPRLYIGVLLFYSITMTFAVDEILIALTSLIFYCRNLELIQSLLYVSMIIIGVGILVKKEIENRKLMPNESQNDLQLYPGKENDITTLINYIENYQIVGLRGEWGIGKSFIIDKFIDRKKSEYNIVEINTMMCNFDELQSNLITELSNLLSENRIYSLAFHALKKSTTILGFSINISNFVNPRKLSFYESIDILKNDLAKLDKTTLIIFEDIDRINDKNTILQILNLTEKLSSSKVKIIHQYSEDELLNKGISYEFLEKYIHHVVNVSGLSFVQNLYDLINDENNSFSNVLIEDFDVFKSHKLAYRFKYFEEISNSANENFNQLFNFKIRSIKKFVREIDNEIGMYSDKNDRDVFVVAQFIKHFYKERFFSFDIDVDIVAQLKFDVNQIQLNIYEFHKLLRESQEPAQLLSDVLKNNANKESYLFIKLINYDLKNIYEFWNFRNHRLSKERFDELYNSKQNLFVDDANEKKQRILRKEIMRFCNNSTDLEVLTNDFVESVLNAENETMLESYYDFINRWFNSEHHIDNNTSFVFGEPNIVTLANGINIRNYDEEISNQFIEFLLIIDGGNILSKNVLNALCRLKFTSSNGLTKAFKSLVEYDINYKIHDLKEFEIYLLNYLKLIGSVGIPYGRDYVNIEMMLENNGKKDYTFLKGRIIENINKYKSEVEKFKGTSLSFIEDEFSAVIKFLEYILRILDEEGTRPREQNISTTTRSILTHKEKIDELNNISNERSRATEIRKAYINKELYLQDVTDNLVDGFLNNN